MPNLTSRPLSQEELIEVLLLTGTFEERQDALRHLLAGTLGALLNRAKMEFGWNLAFAKEPDGSFSWVGRADDGTEIRSGVADSWDAALQAALLAAIDGLHPPSAEASTGS